MRSSIKTSLVAAFGALAALAATSGSARASCDTCSSHTYYRPVVVRHCVHVVRHHVYRPEIAAGAVPVARYYAVRQIRYATLTYYTNYISFERVPLDHDGDYRHHDGHRDSSYGLDPTE